MADLQSGLPARGRKEYHATELTEAKDRQPTGVPPIANPINIRQDQQSHSRVSEATLSNLLNSRAEGK